MVKSYYYIAFIPSFYSSLLILDDHTYFAISNMILTLFIGKLTEYCDIFTPKYEFDDEIKTKNFFDFHYLLFGFLFNSYLTVFTN